MVWFRSGQIGIHEKRRSENERLRIGSKREGEKERRRKEWKGKIVKRERESGRLDRDDHQENCRTQ